jgi:hypothetical protein
MIMGRKIMRGVVRGSRVVARALRLFLAALSPVTSNGRIPRECHNREIRQLSSQRQRQNARFGWINKQEESDLAQTDVSFIDQVPRHGCVSENKKVELWQYSPYHVEGSVGI